MLVCALFLMSATAFGQTVTVNGTVSEAEDGAPLVGATVLEKGTSNGTVTDVDGNYSIAVNEGAVLVFSYTGFESQEIEVGTQSTINVALATNVNLLEEVVVVGYGTQRKEDLTGSVSLADPEEMKKQATNDLTRALQGRVAGVSIKTDGEPGASPTVRIRGVSTFGSGGASAEPLYVVDGTPLAGGIRDINPNDIESVQVLKDATAGAIYGNRASNGVVIITTRKGSKNTPLKVELSSYYGFQSIPDRIPILDRQGYQLIQNEVLTNAGAPLLPGNDPSSPDFIDDIDTDWQDVGYKDGSILNANVNLSGGTDNVNYFVSFDYLDNEGTLVGSGPNYERFTFRANSEIEFGRVKFGENLLVVRSDENPLFSTLWITLPGDRPSLVNDLLQAIPTIPFRDENREGGFGGADAIVHNSISLNVPGVNSLIDNSTLVNRTIGNLWGELEIVEGLSYRLSLSYSSSGITDELFVPEYDLGYFFPGPIASLQITNRNYSSTVIENTLNFNRAFGVHELNVLGGISYQDDRFRQVISRGSGLEKPYVRNLGNATDFSVSDFIDKSTLYSLIGRLNYSFDDRYLLTVNIRRDGSSRFAPGNRFDVFPSVGVAWKVHHDFDMPDFISELKIRGGVGEVGNQFIANYAYQSTVNRGIPYQFGPERVFGGAPTILVDPSIKWETRTTRNAGFDAVFLDGRVEFSAEYYSNTSDDILLALPIPQSVGSVSPEIITNVGSIKNNGIELSGTYRQNFGEFSFEVSPNFYTLNNEVTDLGSLESLSGAGSRTEVGRSIGEHFGWVFDGIFQNQAEVEAHATQTPGTAPGDVRFKDIAGPPDADGNPTGPDGVIDNNDRTFLGQGMPTYYYGLNLVAEYKNFDLTVFGSGSGGNLINSNLYRGLMTSTGFTNWHEDILGRWTPDNPSTTIPRMIWQDPNNNNRDSDKPGWLQDGDYFRINTISLGYTFQSNVVNAISASHIRVYATVQNVVTFSKYKGYNPDFTSNVPNFGSVGYTAGILQPGFDFGTFPRPRTVMFGVQATF